MKRALLMCALFVGIVPGQALAGLDLTWNACNTDGGVSTTTFDCLGGTPSVLYGSWQVPVAQDDVVSLDGALFLAVDQSPMPTFWRFDACNTGYQFNRLKPATGCATAFEMWDVEGADEGIAFLPPGAPTVPPGNHYGRWVFTLFNPSGTPKDVPANRNNFGFALRFLMSRAQEWDGPCIGCTAPAAFVWTSALVGNVRGEGDSGLGYTLDGSGLVSDCALVGSPSFGCLQAVPARNRTWGQIKTLYR